MTGTQPMNARRQLAIDLARDGLWSAEIARRVGMTTSGVVSLLSRFGVKPCKAPRVPPQHKSTGNPRGAPIDHTKHERNREMAIMYRQGLLLAQIGEHFGVTRERVRQILRRLGVDAAAGGTHKRADHKRAAIEHKRDVRSLSLWGLPRSVMKAHRASGVLQGFVQQRNNARMRGIAWELSFPHWLEVWERSGKLEQRGRGKGRYVMSRIKDDGGYVFGNVHIQLSTKNNSDGIKKCRSNKAEFTGVWRIYPGTSKPWIAKAGKHKIGAFATQEEAAAARATFLRDNPDVSIRTGRGYYLVKGSTRRRDRYRVFVGGKHVGLFATVEAAIAARQAFMDALDSKAA